MGPVNADADDAWVPMPAYGSFRALAPGEGPTDWKGFPVGYAIRSDRLAQLEQGQDAVQLALPHRVGGLDQLLTVTMSLRSSQSGYVGVAFVGSDAPVPRVASERFYKYESSPPDSLSPFTGTASSGGGIILTGLACPGAQVFLLQSWSPSWRFIGAESPSAFVGAGPGHCESNSNEGGGNPPTSPPPQPKAYTFYVHGEAKWCTDNAGAWTAIANAVAADTEGGFAPTLAHPKSGIHTCWIATSGGTPNSDAAYNCDAQGPCYSSTGVPYPYGGAARQCMNYNAKVWDDLQYWSQQGFVLPDIAQVLHEHQKPNVPSGCRWNNGEWCGLGLSGWNDQASSPKIYGKVSVSTPTVTPVDPYEQVNRACKAHTALHEMSHNFATQDNDGYTYSCGGYTCGTVMMYNVHVNDGTFTTNNKETIRRCVEATQPSAQCGPNHAW